VLITKSQLAYKIVTHGGRSQHGFFSGFVSSLGGSYTMNLKMGTGAKILLNAVIGGTTEMIGGSLRQMHITHFNHLFC